MHPSSSDTNPPAAGIPERAGHGQVPSGRLAWHTPEVEELPFLHTELNITDPPGPNDVGIYTS